jgi:hypothetical protein
MRPKILLIGVVALAVILAGGNHALAMRDPGIGGTPLYQYGTGGQYANGMNLYQYAVSRPVTLSDPSGLYVNAVVGKEDITMEAGLVLWGSQGSIEGYPRDTQTRPFEDGLGLSGSHSSYVEPGLLSQVEARIEFGLLNLEMENRYKICHFASSKLYPLKWRADVRLSQSNHFFSKPGNWHYVEIKRNPMILGLWGPENAFSPSISTYNNRGGWGVWTYQMALAPLYRGGMWAAHEVLHFAGLWDRYSYITLLPDEGNYLALPGGGYRWPTNIMAGYNGFPRLDKSQVETILKDRLKENPGWELDKDYKVLSP